MKTARQKIDEFRDSPLRLIKDVINSAYYKVNPDQGDRIVPKIMQKEQLDDEDYLYIHKCMLSLQAESMANSGPEGTDPSFIAGIAEKDAATILLDG